MAARAIWGYRLLFAAIAAVILFMALLPFGGGEGGWPGPDIVLCLVFAWVVRRPDYVPAWLTVGVLLLEDVLLMRPLGVWTLIVLLASEWLRRRVDHAEVQTFGAEIVRVASVIGAAFAANHAALLLLLAETPPLAGQAMHALATIAFYPITALFSHLIGVRRLAPGELDTLGSRI